MRKFALHWVRAYGLGLLVMAAMVLATGCGISWWIGERPPVQYVYASPDGGSAPEPAPIHRVGAVYNAGYQTGNGPWFYTSGTAGTVTVPAGACVTGLYTSATASGATLTITPAGPSNQGITDAQVGPPIPIPAGQAFNLGNALLSGPLSQLGLGTICPLQLGVGSVLVFTGTNAYFVGLYEYGGP